MPSGIQSLIIGTAGHIDHGKTALVRRLTGIDTDRLPEEKRRGITIDLGFASLETQSINDSRLWLSFVDVPGHKLFVRNMLAGSGGIDCVMLVISAEEGVKPQTEEHLAICTMLGIRNGLTVLTKVDAVSDAHLRDVRSSVARFLQGSFLSEDRAPILAVSAHTGRGIQELIIQLRSLAVRSPARDCGALPRLPVDRAFVMKGFGTVVTGTLQSGTLSQGQTLVVQPGGREVRVRGLHIHQSQQQSVGAGSRVALNLAGVEVSDVQRGHTLVLPSTYLPVGLIDVELRLLPRAPELRNHSAVRFHAYTSDTLARVSLYGLKSLQTGETGFARLKLNLPVILLPGDRFVIRQCSPALTLGGGRVLDSHPLPKVSQTKRSEWIHALRNSSAGEQVSLRIQRRQTTGLRLSDVVSETGLAPTTVRSIVGKLMTEGEIVTIPGDHYLSCSAITAASQSILDELKNSTPGGQVSPGLRRSELRHRTGLREEAVLQFVTDKLIREQKVSVQGDLIVPFGIKPAMNPADQKKLATITEAYAKAGLAAPLPRSMAELLRIGDSELRRLVTILLRNKILVKVGTEDLYIHSDALNRLYPQIRCMRGQVLDVARFKQMTGLSRKYAIPLLEHLDREHITRKQGDSRVVL